MTKNKKKTQRRGPKPVKRAATILKLRELRRATSAELGVSTAFVFTLLGQNLVQQAGKREKSGKGRKETIWKLSPAGNGVASSLQRKQKVAA